MLELAALVARCYRDGIGSTVAAGWTVAEAARGHNGIVFRARSADADLAAKVSQVDERRRAEREHEALEAIASLEPGVAPEPVGVVREPDGAPVDVLLAAWRGGVPVDDSPPPGSPVWSAIADAYARVHRLPDRASAGLRPAMLGVDLAQVIEDMRLRAERVGDPALDGVVEAARRSIPAGLPKGGASLIHCEASLRNLLVAEDGALTIVDWENSGRGDPCFDLANVVMRPQLARHALAEWDELFVAHAASLGDPRFADRTRVHARLMAAWWAVRLRQESTAPTPRLPGVPRLNEGTHAELVDVCEKRAASLLGL